MMKERRRYRENQNKTIITCYFVYRSDILMNLIYNNRKMKVLLYFEGEKYISKSGIGRALNHQMAALDSQGIEYTLNPKDDYDIAHINTIGIRSSKVLRECKKEI